MWRYQRTIANAHTQESYHNNNNKIDELVFQSIKDVRQSPLFIIKEMGHVKVITLINMKHAWSMVFTINLINLSNNSI